MLAHNAFTRTLPPHGHIEVPVAHFHGGSASQVRAEEVLKRLAAQVKPVSANSASA